MAFRIFDHVLANHGWSATGSLCIAQACKAGEPSAAPCARATPNAEIDALRGRLLAWSKSDRVMCRAAQRLIAGPTTPFDHLARDLGVTERYLLSGLRAAFGVDPHRWRQLHGADAETGRWVSRQRDAGCLPHDCLCQRRPISR